MYALTKENPYDLLKNPLPDDKQCVISNTSIIFLGDSKLQENHACLTSLVVENEISEI